MVQDKLMQELFNILSNTIQHLDAKQGDLDGPDQRTAIEVEIHNAAWALWDRLARHPSVHIGDLDDLPPIEVVPSNISPEQRAANEAHSNEQSRLMLNALVEQTGAKKKEVAAQFGVTPSYLSRMLSGERNTPPLTLALVAQRHGYSLIIKPTATWELKKI